MLLRHECALQLPTHWKIKPKPERDLIFDEALPRCGAMHWPEQPGMGKWRCAAGRGHTDKTHQLWRERKPMLSCHRPMCILPR